MIAFSLRNIDLIELDIASNFLQTLLLSIEGNEFKNDGLICCCILFFTWWQVPRTNFFYSCAWVSGLRCRYEIVLLQKLCVANIFKF